MSQKIVCGGGGVTTGLSAAKTPRSGHGDCLGWGEWTGFKGPPLRAGMGCVLPWAGTQQSGRSPRGGRVRTDFLNSCRVRRWWQRGVRVLSRSYTHCSRRHPVSPGPGEKEGRSRLEGNSLTSKYSPPARALPSPAPPASLGRLGGQGRKRRRLRAAGWGWAELAVPLKPGTRLSAAVGGTCARARNARSTARSRLVQGRVSSGWFNDLTARLGR